jgi:acyl-CoA thioester hydrolase
MTEYSFSISLEPQYRDLDPNGHVNQAVYSSYCEQVRVKYWDAVIGVRHDKAPVALVRSEMEYEAELTLDHTVTVSQRVKELGSSSVVFEYEIRRDDGVKAATSEVVLLCYNRDEKSAQPLPSDWREAITAFEGLEAEE